MRKSRYLDAIFKYKNVDKEDYVLDKVYQTTEEAAEVIRNNAAQIMKFLGAFFRNKKVYVPDPDLLSIIYTEILEKIGNYDCKHKLGCHVFNLAKQRTFNYWRSKMRLQNKCEVLLMGISQPAEEDCASPLDNLIQEEEADKVRAVLKGNSQMETRILELCFLHECTLNEIVHRLTRSGQPVSRATVARICRNFRERVETIRETAI